MTARAAVRRPTGNRLRAGRRRLHRPGRDPQHGLRRAHPIRDHSGCARPGHNAGRRHGRDRPGGGLGNPDTTARYRPRRRNRLATFSHQRMGYTRELPAVFREKRPNRRDQFVGDLHHSLSHILECSLIFCNRFLIGQGLVMLILSQKVCAGRIRTNVPTPGYNIQSLFRILPQHTVALRCTKSLELPQNGFLRGNQC